MNHKLESRLLGEITRYADNTILIAENEEELRSLLMRVKEEREKAGSALKKKLNIKLNIKKKPSDHGIWSHHFMANRRGKSGSRNRLYFLGLQKRC